MFWSQAKMSPGCIRPYRVLHHYQLNNLLIPYWLNIPLLRLAQTLCVRAVRIIEGPLQVKNTGCHYLFTEIVVPKKIALVQERDNEPGSLFIFHPGRAKSFRQCSFLASCAPEE